MEPLHELRRRHRSGDQIALRSIGTHLAQRGEVSFLFDALHHDAEAKVVTEIDDRAHNHVVLFVVEHVAHKRLVNLDLVDRKQLKLGQRREPGPEVVDGDLHAEGPERMQRMPSQRAVGHDLALCDFEHEPIAGHAMITQQPRDEVGKIMIEEVPDRHVDGDGDVHPLRAPLSKLPDSLFDHPTRERLNQTGELAQLHEVMWREQPMARVFPADEPLGTDDTSGAHVDLRLVIQPEIARHDGRSQLAEQLEASKVGGVVVGRGNDEVPPGALRLVHRCVGATQQRRW